MSGNLNLVQVRDHFEVIGRNFDDIQCLNLEDYEHKVIINGCKFNKGLFINECRFRAGLEISNTTIYGSLWFWCCDVMGEFLSHGLHIQNREEGRIHQTYNGEANFSLSRFSGPVSFFALDVSGPSYWAHTKFLDDVSWNHCQLHGKALFINLDGYISVRKMDIELQEDMQHYPRFPGLFTSLINKGFLKRDDESPDSVATVFIEKGKTEEIVRAWSLPENVTSHLVSLFENRAQPMFAVGKKVEFDNITFGSLTFGNKYADSEDEVITVFKEVDFSSCSRFNTNFQYIRFEDCTWKEVKSKPLRLLRPQLAEEAVMIREGTREIITTYMQLATAYMAQDKWEYASNWRYSAREVQRRMADTIVERVLRFLDFWVLGGREFAMFPLLWSSLLFSGLVIMAIVYGENVWLWQAVQSLITGKGIPAIEASNAVSTFSMVVGGLIMLLLSIAGSNFVNRHGWFLLKSSQSK